MFDEEPDPDPHGECAEEIRRLTNQRDHALDDLKAEIANHREDLAALEDAEKSLLWISTRYRSKDESSADVLQEIRGYANSRMVAIRDVIDPTRGRNHE